MNLTKRETEVVQLSAIGATADEIAAQFGSSVQTVRTQIKVAREKLGARNVAHLVAISISKGFIQALSITLCLCMLTGIDDGLRRGRTHRVTQQRTEVVIYA